mgnify:CR=1 FL=1
MSTSSRSGASESREWNAIAAASAGTLTAIARFPVAVMSADASLRKCAMPALMWAKPRHHGGADVQEFDSSGDRIPCRSGFVSRRRLR